MCLHTFHIILVYALGRIHIYILKYGHICTSRRARTHRHKHTLTTQSIVYSSEQQLTFICYNCMRNYRNKYVCVCVRESI